MPAQASGIGIDIGIGNGIRNGHLPRPCPDAAAIAV
jgi:hypothetical protein